VKYIIPVTNFVLVLAIVGLSAWGVKTWTQPKYPAQVDGSALRPVPKVFDNLKLNRPVYSPNAVDEISSGNFFRKQRKEYQAPPPPPPPPPIAVAAPGPPPPPPPSLQLKGVMLLNGKKIAILEGDYAVREANNKVTKKNIKRRGYTIGEQISGYEIVKIEKKLVTMDNKRGGLLLVNLTQRSPSQKIQRRDGEFFHKSKSFSPQKIKVHSGKKKKSKKKRRTVSRQPALAPNPSASVPAPVPLPVPQPVVREQRFHVSGSD